MIDRSLFNLERLLDAMLNTLAGNVNKWLDHVEIVTDYMPRFPTADTRPACVVRYDKLFLRWSAGPRQGYFWDCYGDDFVRPEMALLAVVQSPVPPSAMRPEIWESKVANPRPAASPAGEREDGREMAKYRKKPVVIEAEQFKPDSAPLPFADRGACCRNDGYWYVVTAHGQETRIVDGDWIIPEPDGRGFYPCKPDIFAATYEPVQD